jgi:ligand-binding sensor domain-containing protein
MAEARIVYLATDDGLIQLANPGRSDRWREVGRALVGRPVHAVAAAPHDPLLAVARTADAVHRSTNGGISWEEIWQGHATALAFDEQGTLYVGTEHGTLLRSMNGAHWDELLRADAPIRKTIVLVEQRIIFCDPHTIYEWTSEHGQRFASFAPETELLGVTASPTLPQHVTVVGEAVGTPGAARSLTGALVMLGGSEPVLLAGTQGTLLRSATGSDVVAERSEIGAAAINVVIINVAQPSPFKDVPGPQHVTALVTPPRYLDQVFATTAGGELWLSTERGRNWTTLRTDLPPINDCAFARAM